MEMTMFKITLENTWKKHGIPTNYIKYLKVESIEDVWKYYNVDDVVEVVEC